jgi:hypothetical protein
VRRFSFHNALVKLRGGDKAIVRFYGETLGEATVQRDPHDEFGAGAAFAPGRSGRRDEMDKERNRVACGTLDAEREKTER